MSELNVLAIDFEPIEHAMRDLIRETNEYFMDRNSGQVIVISRSVIRYLSDEATLRVHDLPDWEARMIPMARDIIIADSKRYIRVPEAYGCPEHRWMKQFSETLKSSKMKEAIVEALKGRWSCTRFKEILKEDSDAFQRWTTFRSECWKGKIQNWLEEWKILGVNGNPKKDRAATS